LVAKALKIEHCIICLFNKFYPEVKDPGNNLLERLFFDTPSRFKCINDDAKRKNGNHRIISKDIIEKGKIPGWCPLDDYEVRPVDWL